MSKQYKLWELFGGIGAPRHALINVVGEENVKSGAYVEIDPMPVKIYNMLFENKHRPESVVGFNIQPDFLVHGSPCQDFSLAGKGVGGFHGTNTRSSLMWDTVKILHDLGEQKPKVVIWENVKGVLSKNKRCQTCRTLATYNENGTQACECGETSKTNLDNFKLYLESMSELGYDNHHKVLNGMNFGIPQARERVFVVSILKGATEYQHFSFDKVKQKPMRPLRDFLEQNIDEKYIIKQPSMVEALLNGKIKINDTYAQTITTRQMRWNNAGLIKMPVENFTPKGEGSKLIVTDLSAFWDGDKCYFSHNDDNYFQLRIITPIEALRLMGFAEKRINLIKHLPDLQLYHVAGNSMIVDVVEAIFRALITPQT